MYCAPCHIFTGNIENASLASAPATDPSNIGKMIGKHQSSKRHLQSQEAADNFISIMKGDKKDINSCLSSKFNSLVEKNRQILVSIVDAIVLCGKQNIAFRGHEEENSNFKALLEYQSKYNAVLKDHLQHGDPRSKYTSPRIQN